MDPLRPKATNGASAHVRGVDYRRRIGGGLMFGAGLLAFTTLFTPHSGKGTDEALAVMGALALLIGVLLVAWPAFAPLWATPLFVGFGTMLITLDIYTGGLQNSLSSDNQVLYLLVVFYSFYFLRGRLAVVQLVLVGGAYGFLLIDAVPVGQAAARWAVMMLTLTVAGLLVGLLNRRVELLLAELTTSARRDPLTGALNRRGLDERLTVEIARAERTTEPLTLVVADLDDLKGLNDRYGHGAGDQALELAAKVMRGGLRETDALARIGGDEFVLILPNCEPEAGLEIAQKVRARLRQLSADELQPLTMSAGAAGAPPLPLEPVELLAAADRALYRSKQEGRDRSSLAEA
ncbi:MAG: GGDEF domain-containing protein [Thermoleophilaceae bacterium]|nr:GGDEF domain-containing protein [Thermoleophilaceae bacterium]